MNAEEKIKEVSIYTLSWYIADWINKKKCKKCKLLAFDTTLKKWCALDNSANDCWTEFFETRQEAIDWLNNEMKKPTDNCNYQSAGGKESLRLSASIIPQEE